MISFTLFHEPGVAKSYKLQDGKAVKNSAENFKTGTYETVRVSSIGELRDFLRELGPGDFITAGVHQKQASGRCGLGAGDIRRTKDEFPFHPGEPGLCIIDSDKLDELNLSDIDSFATALEKLIGEADYVLSPSASSGITVNGIVGPIRGMHTFVFIEDTASIPDALAILHKRSILLGYARPLITKNGAILIRSLVDLAMKTPNQPCFEGGAILGEGITQERSIHSSKSGDVPKFLEVMPLTQDEERLVETKSRELSDSVADEAERVRTAWRAEREGKMIANGCAPEEAKRIIDQALTGARPVLSSDFKIHTDNFGIKTVCELLADPEKYHEATCADPLDPEDGAGKAKIYTLNKVGRPAINSHAHGGGVFIMEEECSPFQVEVGYSLSDSANSQVFNESANVNANQKTVVDDFIVGVNRRFALIEGVGIYDKDNGRFFSRENFRMFFANQSVDVGTADSPKLKAGDKAWLESARRAQYKGLAIEPNQAERTASDCLNVYRGYSATSEQGDVRPFLDLLEWVLPNEVERHYFLCFIAFKIQNPTRRYAVAAVLWSRTQGVGKNLLVEHCVSHFHKDHFCVRGQEVFSDGFTEWRHKKLFCVLDEVSSTRVRTHSDRIKGWITSTDNPINWKNRDKFDEPNLIAHVFLSNHADAVYVDGDNRRHWVSHCREERVPEDLVDRFVTWRDDGGISFSLHYLLEFDTGSFNPFAHAPMTKAKKEMAEDNLSDFERWVNENISVGTSAKVLVTAAEVTEEYRFKTGNKASSRTATKALAGIGAVRLRQQVLKSDGRRPRVYALRDANKYEQLSSSELGKILEGQSG